jgi:hypothetical protein
MTTNADIAGPQLPVMATAAQGRVFGLQKSDTILSAR